MDCDDDGAGDGRVVDSESADGNARPRTRRMKTALTVLFVLSAVRASAHSGPPYPVVSNRAVGAYVLSVWTDPDATDDRTPAGRFWVTIKPAVKGASLPSATSAHVAIRALDRPA